jgi:hypothetical protein
MSILKKDKLADLLTANWTKFIDYRTLMSLVINSVKLYASNWSMLEYDKKIQGNKIMVSKTILTKQGLLFWVDFEVPIENKLAIGTIELCLDLSGNYHIEKIVGNLFYNV